jgi:hypothetical protein
MSTLLRSPIDQGVAVALNEAVVATFGVAA